MRTRRVFLEHALASGNLTPEFVADHIKHYYNNVVDGVFPPHEGYESMLLDYLAKATSPGAPASP